MTKTSNRLRTTLLAGAGLLLLQLGWALSLAPAFGIDEFDHAYRASSVAAGHWQPGNDLVPVELGRGDLIPVRADVAQAASGACQDRPYTGAYNCTPKTVLDNDNVLIASAASRYNPTFYAVVGTAAKPFHGTANLFAMRIVTALLACVLFMLTVWLTIAGARTVWPLLAVLLAALPTTVYSASIASPNGVELMAGLATWVAVLTLVRGPRGEQRRGSAYALAALGSAVLANTHTLGLMWIAMVLVAVAVLHGTGRTVRALLPRSPGEGVLAVAAISAAAFEVAWLLTSGANDPSLEHSTFSGSPISYVLTGLVLWPLQAIGAFPMRDQPAPLAVYVLVLLVLLVLFATAFRRIRIRSRTARALVFVAVTSWVLPAILTVRAFHEIGAAWQGRYGMPFSVGLLVIAAGAIDAHRRPTRRTGAVAAAGVVLLVCAQLVSQVSVMLTERRNHDLLDATGWNPPSVVLLGGLAVLALCCWLGAAARAARTEERDPSEVIGPRSEVLV